VSADRTELPAAVVFDCDGTLVDTETISDRTLRAVLARHAYEPTDDDFAAIRGRPWPHTWGRFAEQVGLDDEHAFRRDVGATFREIFDREGRLFDDAEATARALVERGVPLAVCTSSSRRHLERVLDLGLRELIDVSVAAEDTERHKPDPAPYLAAAERLGVAPTACVAIEDSPVGLASARAAGMPTVGVARHGVDPEVLAGADLVVARVDLTAVVAAAGRRSSSAAASAGG
jgi:HAD superfamily hydrolase (TIGR01509 family)